ncbi:MAG: uracil-DNA glycosylase [Holosporales bacterium]|jgi:DNA polymerase|nr:uracil-DNA glycosylase [Holosporales bacterium]
MQKAMNAWMESQVELGEDIILTELDASSRNIEHRYGSKVNVSDRGVVAAKGEGKAKQSDTPSSISPSSQPYSSSSQSSYIQPSPSPRTSPPKFLRADASATRSINANSLDELKAQICAFDGCALKAMAHNTVFADGNPNSAIMFIGEAPGADEDMQGVPFVGQSGQLLNKMLESVGLKREDVYITNVINWRPPGNRPPTTEEISMCAPFLERHIELVAPKILVLLGSTAMRAVLKCTSSLSSVRSMWHECAFKNLPSAVSTMVTFHPSYLLRVPSQKRLAWEDFLMLKSYYEERAA